MTLNRYLARFKNLNVSRSNGIAPHKPVLLLSVILAIEEKEIDDNRIAITPELVARFKEVWQALVEDSKFTSKFYLPFYHLKTDKFWHLHTYPGWQILLTSSHSVKSLSSLKDAVAYASLDNELFELLQIPENRNLLREALLNTYFSGKQLKNDHYNLFHKIEQQILHDSPLEYITEVIKADEDEKFIRSGVFKKVIPGIYNYTCCISGMRLIATREIQMIDACHIVPFSQSHDDTITNGLSLSPNFHRAFDRFLITIDSGFNVIVADNFIESENYPIKQFHNKPIILPQNPDFHPSIENLKWHNDQFYQINKS